STKPGDLTAPCDGLLSCYKIKEDTVIPVKQSEYRIADLLENESLAKEFYNGSCLVYRLCVNHYHRYAFFDDCGIKSRKFIKGVLHTVRPVALENVPVFVRNSREYTLFDTVNFGRAVQMEVGAMLVGKIDNYYSEGSYKRGQQKGRFLYGGSTVIVLLTEGAATVREDILMNTSEYKETPVRMGEVVGRAQALS
ncbi:MAG: phosphatidylserine decarboxylase, partial [Clostridiales bacterium]|nr:phosphatidylserine decarboxylase [Clostridiales bacterium]